MHTLFEYIDRQLYRFQVWHLERRSAALRKELANHPGYVRLEQSMLNQQYEAACANLRRNQELKELQLRHDIIETESNLTRVHALQRGRAAAGV